MRPAADEQRLTVGELRGKATGMPVPPLDPQRTGGYLADRAGGLQGEIKNSEAPANPRQLWTRVRLRAASDIHSAPRSARRRAATGLIPQGGSGCGPKLEGDQSGKRRGYERGTSGPAVSISERTFPSHSRSVGRRYCSSIFPIWSRARSRRLFRRSSSRAARW